MKLDYKYSKPCKECSKIFFKSCTQSKKTWLIRTKFCSQKCHDLWRHKNCRMEKSGNWKGLPDYMAIHKWIHFNYGKANKCENRSRQFLEFNCSDKFDKYQWARLHNKPFERSRKSFVMLCVSCHNKYDHNAESHARRVETMKGWHHTDEAKLLISIASKRYWASKLVNNYHI